MKHFTLLSLLIFCSFIVNAQVSKSDCSDLFFSELTFGKVSHGEGLFDLNYAVEIFNPTQTTIDLADYTLELTNNVGATTHIFLDGKTINAGDVFVVCNSNADLNLRAMADTLSSGLKFDDNITLDLKHDGDIIDRVGESGGGLGSFDLVQFLANPTSYLASFHIDLREYNNIDIRRSMFVSHGESDFVTADQEG